MLRQFFQTFNGQRAGGLPFVERIGVMRKQKGFGSVVLGVFEQDGG